MKTITTTAAVLAAIITSAHAYTDTYMCRVPIDHRAYPVTLNSAAKFAADGKGTLSNNKRGTYSEMTQACISGCNGQA